MTVFPLAVLALIGRRPRAAVLSLVALSLCTAAPASADLVFLASGGSLSVRAVRYDGDEAVLTLRNGGEMVCSRAAIARVTPDEAPWPDPPPVGGGDLATDVTPVSAGAAPVGLPVAQAPAEYRALVGSLSRAHGVDENLVHAVIAVESAWQPKARSAKGARGLMQLMPATARQYGVRNAYVPAANLNAGIRHLRSLLDRFDVSLALAAYNAGEATVRRFNGIPPYRETREYVTRVLSLASALRVADGAASLAAQQP